MDVKDLLSYENDLKNNGIRLIAGVDEVGRGSLAGPVVCASVIMDLDNLIVGVNDSKKLTEKKRELLYDKILEKAISCSIYCVEPKIIDEINILEATRLCMTKAVENLDKKPEVVLVDAMDLKDLDKEIKQISIIKGDATSYSIACASSVAKVYLDRLMVELSGKYPEYNFAKHKGYGTKEHISAIKVNGICEIHRKTFVKNFINKE